MEDWLAALSTSPLAKRAWVIQERFFSPRILHFKEDRIFWECDEESRVVSEYSTDAYGGTVASDYPYPLQPFTLPAIPSNRSSTDAAAHDSRARERDLRWQWFWIVGKYSEAALTFPAKDKLVAFGGIAKRFSQALGDDYVAGCFRRQLPQTLFWDVTHSTPCRETPAYQAPSWSWASVNAKTGVLDLECTSHDRLLECVVDLHDLYVEMADATNPHGRINYGEITVCGILLCLERPGLDWRTFLAETYYPGADAGYHFDCTVSFRPRRAQVTEQSPAVMVYPDYLKEFVEGSGQLFALPLLEDALSKEGNPGLEPYGKSNGLVLKQSKCADKFERVGICRSWEGHLAKPLLDEG